MWSVVGVFIVVDELVGDTFVDESIADAVVVAIATIAVVVVKDHR